jgi:peptide/nickel transport system permease protein
VRRLQRIVVALFTFALVCVLAFVVIESAPGDPTSAQLGIDSGAMARDALREALGLHGGVFARLGRWLFDLARLDLGTSTRSSSARR